MLGGFECLAQPAYVHVYRPLLDKDVIAPDLVEQLGAAVDALRMGHEEMQHPELGRPHVDVATGGGDAQRARLQPQAPALAQAQSARLQLAPRAHRVTAPRAHTDPRPTAV